MPTKSPAKKIVHGSWKNKIVASDLQEERDKKDFTGDLNDILDKSSLKGYIESMNF